MSNRTTINVGKTRHEAASDVKEAHGETWGDVLEFYTFYRDEFPAYAVDSPNEVSMVDIGATEQSMQGVDTSDVVEELETKIDSLAFDGALTDREADKILTTLETLEERTNRIESRLDDVGAKR